MRRVVYVGNKYSGQKLSRENGEEEMKSSFMLNSASFISISLMSEKKMYNNVSYLRTPVAQTMSQC